MNIILNTKMKFKLNYLFWLLPVLAFLPQLLMTLNSFNQIRFEEFIEAVQAPLWLDHRLIINGLHVNVGWYAFLLLVYKIFGFSLHTGKISYLVMAFFANFALFYLLRRFLKVWVAALLLFTLSLSPTYLYMNALNLHWALTFHILIAILMLLYYLDFSKKYLSMVMTTAIFLLMMWGWLSYQAFVFYIPSLCLFYFWKFKKIFSYPHLLTSVLAFLLPLLILFVYVENRHLLVADAEKGGGLFRGGGRLVLSDDIFTQGWTDLISDFFIRGVSHHYEINMSEFSLIFPILTLIFIFFAVFKIWKKIRSARFLISLVVLVAFFDIVIFSTTSDFGLPGMKRLTPLLVAIYFLWAIVWYYLGRGKVMIILSLLTVHHLIVYPINLAYLKEPSPFKVADWFDEEDPQGSVDRYVKIAQKEDFHLDCRPILQQFGGCDYVFIYSALSASCRWNRLNCHNILGYDVNTNQYIPISLDWWQ